MPLLRKTFWRRGEHYGTCGDRSCVEFVQRQVDLFLMIGDVSTAHTELRVHGEMIVKEAQRSPLGEQMVIELGSMKDMITEILESVDREAANDPIPHSQVRDLLEAQGFTPGPLLGMMTPLI